MRRLFTFATILVLLGIGSIFTTHANVIPTTQWVNFYSSDSTIDNEPLPVGSVVRAYNMAGNQCGEYVVRRTGYYGFLACYIDDPNTPMVEGIRAGEAVRFTVNGLEAGTTAVPATLINGMRIRFDLRAATVLSVNLSCVDGYENDDVKQRASSITGPEGRTFFSERHGWDQDWGKFNAKANWTYQIRARSPQPLDITHPILRLYDADGCQ